MTRFKAAGIHLAISAAVGTTVSALILLIWYAPPLFSADQGATLNLLLIGVDLILGPLLTFIVFRAGKPGLRFDLGVIALLQVSALAYGLWVLGQSRPVYIVLQERRATLVHRNELYAPASTGPFAHTELWRIRAVAALPPSDPSERDALLTATLSGEPDLDYRPAHYRELAQTPEIAAFGRSLAQVLAGQPELAARLPATVRKANAASELRLLPLLTRDRELAVVFDPAQARIVAIVDARIE